MHNEKNGVTHANSCVRVVLTCVVLCRLSLSISGRVRLLPHDGCESVGCRQGDGRPSVESEQYADREGFGPSPHGLEHFWWGFGWFFSFKIFFGTVKVTLEIIVLPGSIMRLGISLSFHKLISRTNLECIYSKNDPFLNKCTPQLYENIIIIIKYQIIARYDGAVGVRGHALLHVLLAHGGPLDVLGQLQSLVS